MFEHFILNELGHSKPLPSIPHTRAANPSSSQKENLKALTRLDLFFIGDCSTYLVTRPIQALLFRSPLLPVAGKVPWQGEDWQAPV